MSIAEQHQESFECFSIHVWFYPRSLGILPLGPGPWGWAPSQGMDLQLCQSVVGHFNNFCAIFTPAHLVDRTNCRTKGFVTVFVSQSLHQKSWLVRGDDQFRLHIPHCQESQLVSPSQIPGISIALGFQLVPQMPPDFSFYQYFISPSSPHLIFISIPITSLQAPHLLHCQCPFCFSFTVRFMHPPC